VTANVSVAAPSLPPPRVDGAARRGNRRAYVAGTWADVPVLPRDVLGVGDDVVGPAIVEYPESTCLVPSGWAGAVDGVGTLVLERRSWPDGSRSPMSTAPPGHGRSSEARRAP
jgi:N-methylhydantoinase A